jgi:hypothetical protein
MDLWVKNVQALPPPEINNSIKMEVGIEDCLHIEFEYNRSKYHLKDVVIGKIYFLLVRLKIKHMEIEIRKRESTGAGLPFLSLRRLCLTDGSDLQGPALTSTTRARPSRNSRSWTVVASRSPCHWPGACDANACGRRPCARRVGAGAPLPLGLRPHAHLPQHQQQVQRQVSPARGSRAPSPCGPRGVSPLVLPPSLRSPRPPACFTSQPSVSTSRCVGLGQTLHLTLHSRMVSRDAGCGPTGAPRKWNWGWRSGWVKGTGDEGAVMHGAVVRADLR